MTRQEAAAKVIAELEFALKMVRILAEDFNAQARYRLLDIVRRQDQVIVIGGPDTLSVLLAQEEEGAT